MRAEPRLTSTNESGERCLVGDDQDRCRVLDDVSDPTLGPVGSDGNVGQASLEYGQQGDDQLLGRDKSNKVVFTI